MVPPKPTQYQIAQENCDHDTLIQVYHLHQIVSAALKKVLMENIDNIFLGSINSNASTILKLMEHLKDNYYKI